MTEFLLYYGAGLLVVTVLFTAILFERSYHLKGIFIGASYSGLAGIFFISPLLLDTFVLDNFFYTMELFTLMILAGLIVFIGSLAISRILIKK